MYWLNVSQSNRKQLTTSVTDYICHLQENKLKTCRALYWIATVKAYRWHTSNFSVKWLTPLPSLKSSVSLLALGFNWIIMSKWFLSRPYALIIPTDVTAWNRKQPKNVKLQHVLGLQNIASVYFGVWAAYCLSVLLIHVTWWVKCVSPSSANQSWHLPLAIVASVLKLSIDWKKKRKKKTAMIGK